MKRALLFVSTCLIATTFHTMAAISVAWFASGGFVPDAADETVGILTMPQNPTGQGLAQLIFTPSGAISRAMVGAHEKLVSGDNAVLASIVLEVGNAYTGSEFGDILFNDEYYNPVFTPGFLFVRVFERNLPDITLNTRYYDGPLHAVVENLMRPIVPPQSIDANRNELTGGIGDALYYFDPLMMSVGVIPEPGTLGLMSLGFVVAAWGRKRTA